MDSVQIIDIATKLAEYTESLKVTDNIIILESFAELKVNNIDYQVQVHLEPRKNYWVDEKISGTFRQINED